MVSAARQPPGNLRGPPGTSGQPPVTSGQPPGTSGDLRATSGEARKLLDFDIIWRRCCQLDDLRRFRHFWFNSVEKLRKHSNQRKLPTLGCRGCRGLFQAKNANQTQTAKRNRTNQPIHQAIRQSGNQHTAATTCKPISQSECGSYG